MTLVLLILMSVCISSMNGQEFFPTPCPNVQPMSTFDITKYTGFWYEAEKFAFIPEILGTCVRVEYWDTGNNTFGVNIIQNVGLKEMKNPGTTTYRSRDGSADFNLYLQITQSPIPFTVLYPYLVLDTDYVNYTIKWSCRDVGFIFRSHFEGLWILTRSPNGYTAEIRDKVHRKLASLGIDVTRLIKSDTSTCSSENDLISHSSNKK